MIMHFKFLFNRFFKNNEIINEIEAEYEAQKVYTNEIWKLNFNTITCNKCKTKGNFEIKGYYYRKIIIDNYSPKIRITRIKCQNCNRTHAILFLDFIPYCQLSTLNSNHLILQNFIDDLCDSQLIERLKNRINKFEQRLKDIGISVFTSTIEEVTRSYNQYRRETYLQIHKGIVILFSSS